MFWFVMYVSESTKSTHREFVRFQGSNSVAFHFQKIIFLQWLQIWSSYCFHCDTEQLWTKQQQDKVFETDFIDSQKSDPPFAHLLALSHVWTHPDTNTHTDACAHTPRHTHTYTTHTHYTNKMKIIALWFVFCRILEMRIWVMLWQELNRNLLFLNVACTWTGDSCFAESHFKDNPALSMLNDSDEEVHYS